MGPLQQHLTGDHTRLDALLDRASEGGRFDVETFERFRSGLLRHIAVEEKVLLKDAKERLGHLHPIARRLRVEHGAIASLLVPTPDLALVGELRKLLREHNTLEEGPHGLYAQCEALAGPDIDALVERCKAVPEVPTARHYDGKGVCRTAEEALAAAERMRPPRP